MLKCVLLSVSAVLSGGQVASSESGWILPLQNEQLEIAGIWGQWQVLGCHDRDAVTVPACQIGECLCSRATSVSQPADSAWCQHLIQQLQQGFEGGGLVEQVAADDDRPG